MIKLNVEDFQTLQDGLDALMERDGGENNKEKQKLLKRIQDAENALITMGTY